ncbi:MAG: nucleoside diphosphate kinase regulator [Kiritimatiellia bacterium]|nr:nucleoside diphosphate kinase regulator [Kiritimatiellia bacterium]
MKKRAVCITEFDRQRLLRLIEDRRYEDPKRAGELEALEQELAGAKSVAPKDIPPDVVTMNSRVQLVDLDTNEDLHYTLVFPEDADVAESKISVLAPIGTAILGYREGYEFDWQVPDGVRRLKIVQLEYQPEAAGNFSR